MSVVPAAGGIRLVRLQVPTPTLVDGPSDLLRNPSRLPSASGVVASSTAPGASSAAATTTESSPTGASKVGSYATTPRHRGNSEQPQKSLPAFDPRRAVRPTMGRSHFGQFGIGSDTGTEVPLMSLTPWDQRSF